MSDKREWRSMTPQERKEAVVAVYDPGYSYSQLASMLGCSRCAIAGIFFRYPDLVRRPARIPTAKKVAPKKPRTPLPPAAPKPIPSGRIVKFTPRETLPLPEPVMIAAPSLKLTLDQLTERVCKWPTHGPDEIGLTYFCGHPRERGSYCAAHHKLSVGRGTDQERAALRGIKG